MAKRDNGGKGSTAATAGTANTTTTDAMEQRMMAFAEQLGRMVGTVQARAEGWMDRDALNKQITSVRDSAAELLEQLSDGVTSLTKAAKKTAVSAATRSKITPGRSGGVVDAPGKKHRKPAPRDLRMVAADAKRVTLQAGKASMKTMKQRGRG